MRCEESSLLLRLGPVSFPLRCPAPPLLGTLSLLSELLPAVPRSRQQQGCRGGTLGPAAGLWYEGVSHLAEPQEAWDILVPSLLGSCSGVVVPQHQDWKRPLETPGTPSQDAFLRSQCNGGCLAVSSRGLGVHGPPSEGLFHPPGVQQEGSLHIHYAHPQGHVSALQPWVLSFVFIL